MSITSYQEYYQQVLNLIDLEIAIRKEAFQYIDFADISTPELQKKEFELIILLDVRIHLKTNHLPLPILKFIKYSIIWDSID